MSKTLFIYSGDVALKQGAVEYWKYIHTGECPPTSKSPHFQRCSFSIWHTSYHGHTIDRSGRISVTNEERIMGYLQSSLSGEEKLLHIFSVHWAGWVWYISLSFLWIGIPGLLRLIGTEMGITSKRVVHKIGIIGRKTNEIKIPKIETVELDQSMMGRIFGYGNIRITGTGVSDVTIHLFLAFAE
jgi:hypothetical protein